LGDVTKQDPGASPEPVPVRRALAFDFKVLTRFSESEREEKVRPDPDGAFSLKIQEELSRSSPRPH
jgi:hypothetical protein